MIRKDGSHLVIEPALPRSLLTVLGSLEPIDDLFPPIEELAPTPVDLARCFPLDTDLVGYPVDAIAAETASDCVLVTDSEREFEPVPG